MTTPFAKVTHVILDLDGTLINTEQLVDEVVSAVLHKRGDFTASRVRKAMEHVRGMRPRDVHVGEEPRGVHSVPKRIFHGREYLVDVPTVPARQARLHRGGKE